MNYHNVRLWLLIRWRRQSDAWNIDGMPCIPRPPSLEYFSAERLPTFMDYSSANERKADRVAMYISLEEPLSQISETSTVLTPAFLSVNAKLIPPRCLSSARHHLNHQPSTSRSFGLPLPLRPPSGRNHPQPPRLPLAYYFHPQFLVRFP